MEQSTAQLRIFSYLPNPRVWKSLIAADLCGVSVEVVGDKPPQLANWLWDYDARMLSEDERNPDSPHARVGRRGFAGTLYKTDAFLQTQPFGTVPCAFMDGGETGVFESNSILRSVVRCAANAGDLYGQTGAMASRIDSFLDANLVFAREAQVYLLQMDAPSEKVHTRMAGAYEFYLAGVERALSCSAFLCGDALSIADISFVCDFAQFLREGHYREALAKADLPLLSADGPKEYPNAYAHMLALSETPEFAQHLGSYLNWYRDTLDADTRPRRTHGG